MMMQKTNKLIDDFKNQTMNTIWKHLNRMAANYSIYCTHLNGLAPFLTDYDIYLYCNDTAVVIVCLDCCGNSEEQTYEESETLSSLVMAEGCEPRISMVWKMAEAVRHVKNCLQSTNPSIEVYGVLLTEANITNFVKLYQMWEAHGVTVIDYLNRLKYKNIKVNCYENDDLPCKNYVQAIIDASSAAAKPEQPTTYNRDDDDEEFTKLLEHFIHEGMEVVDENDTTVNTEDDQPEEETNEDDFKCGNTDNPIDEFQFPTGEIEQNNNINVKVEVLRPIANPHEELDKLVGCTGIKRRMDELIALTRYNQMMREQFPNGKMLEVSLHSVFLGRPGTGKTTVCKIFGSLLRQAGALSRGHVVVCDRGTFIGTLWGDEERSMRQVLEMAQGGVLMIDEAYLLNSKHEGDPGKLVIPLLMNILADESQRDIAVVLCGYKEPMMKLLNLNPGLQSRFPNKFEFEDFTIDELLEITKRRVKEYNYQFTMPAWKKYRDVLSQAYQMRDPETWGNARFVANQLERIYIQHAARCVKHPPKDKNKLLMLTHEDILPIELPCKRTKIGF